MKTGLPKGKRAASGVLLAVFELYQLIWPDLISQDLQNVIYKIIAGIAATGIIDYLLTKKIEK
jgi:hypothetical protein